MSDIREIIQNKTRYATRRANDIVSDSIISDEIWHATWDATWKKAELTTNSVIWSATRIGINKAIKDV